MLATLDPQPTVDSLSNPQIMMTQQTPFAGKKDEQGPKQVKRGSFIDYDDDNVRLGSAQKQVKATIAHTLSSVQHTVTSVNHDSTRAEERKEVTSILQNIVSGGDVTQSTNGPKSSDVSRYGASKFFMDAGGTKNNKYQINLLRENYKVAKEQSGGSTSLKEKIEHLSKVRESLRHAQEQR